MSLRIILLLAMAIMLVPPAADAHKPSDSYLTLTVAGGSIDGRWDIALRDLDHAIGLDGNDDGVIDWGELRGRQDAVAAYALARLGVSADGAACSLVATDHLVERHSDGGYAVLAFSADCPGAAQPTPIIGLDVSYRLFFDLDPQHRGLLQITGKDTTQSAIFGPETTNQQFSLGEIRPWRQLATYVWEGARHVWIGLDHVLFLLTLLLPAVLRRDAGRWIPADGPRAALGEVLAIVTAFTIAHSITLGLAALDIVALPSRLVESVIAASVVIAALNNVVPIITRRIWLVAFGFGLIHGFGFAGVLADLGLPAKELAFALVEFNVGIELGQLAIVAAFLPLVFLIRATPAYPRWVMPAGSLAVAAIGAVWLFQRAFAIPPALS